MVATDRVKEIFADARAMQAQALQRLERSDVRDAAEKAWCATKRATDALELARTGEEPELSRQTAQELRKLQGEDPAVRQYNLRGRYYTRQGALHGDCFYFGLCAPWTRRSGSSGRPSTTSLPPRPWPSKDGAGRPPRGRPRSWFSQPPLRHVVFPGTPSTLYPVPWLIYLGF